MYNKKYFLYEISILLCVAKLDAIAAERRAGPPVIYCKNGGCCLSKLLNDDLPSYNDDLPNINEEDRHNHRKNINCEENIKNEPPNIDEEELFKRAMARERNCEEKFRLNALADSDDEEDKNDSQHVRDYLVKHHPEMFNGENINQSIKLSYQDYQNLHK